MNIISHNCLAGHIYKKYFNKEYENPFIWTVIDFNSMKNLIKNWNIINFNNYELIKDKNWNFSIIIDKLVKVQYVHYKFDPKINKLTKINGNFYYNKIWEFIIYRYEKYKEIMLKNNKKPIFCFCNGNTIYPDCIYTDKQLLELNKYDNTRVIITNEKIEVHEAADKIYNKFIKYEI
jgi:hypothetical protein